MSDERTRRAHARDGRWLLGWILRVSGAALFAGVGLGTIGALRKWGLHLPPATLTTMAVCSLAAAVLLGAGQILMHISPRVCDSPDEETPR